MISKSKIESMGLLNWLEKNNVPFSEREIEREDDNYYYVYLQTNCKEIEKLDNCYEYLKKLVLVNKSKATEFSILKLISEKLPKFMTKEICLAAVKNDGMYLKDVPQQYLDQELCLSAIKNNVAALKCVPAELLSEERCFELVNIDPALILYVNNEDFEKRYLPHIGKNAPCALPKTDLRKSGSMISKKQGEGAVYDITKSDSKQDTIYYISDIHLEHQLDLAEKSFYDIKCLIREKIEELLSKISEKCGILLVGGDVADNKLLTMLFYSELRKKWYGKIISVLGNHELWDSDVDENNSCSAEGTIEKYRSGLKNVDNVFLLENDLLINYKGNMWVTLSESEILKTPKEEFAKICESSSTLILGGIGFAGMNKVYNADSGLYRQVISREQEKERSHRFQAVYDKVSDCAKNISVIVLTHMPMKDWSEAKYNPNWIYINGHTHINTMSRECDGTTVFADNQIGYEPKTWVLNGFTIDKGIYDPFKDHQDGTYSCDKYEYTQFNRGRGIKVSGNKRLTDNMFFIKRDGYYLFLQYNKNGKLQLLNGGRVKTLDRKKEYYEENFWSFVKKVYEILSPYQNALKAIANEVKKIGGTGIIHGSIVDIDWFNHIYLNPLDGRITPYCATDMIIKQSYSSVEELLSDSPYMEAAKRENMLKKFLELQENKMIAILSKIGEDAEKRIIPKIVLDTDMYRPSNNMKSFQYIFEQKVLRRWDDAVLNYNAKATRFIGNDDE